MSDYIKREDAIKAVAEYTKDCFGTFEDAILNAEDVVLDSVPSADVIEPKRGEWIDEADKYDASFGIHDYRCSNCNSYADEYIGGHEWYTAGKPNFCPYCGADMREREGK